MSEKVDLQSDTERDESVTWSQVRVEADREEDWQHNLTIWQGLKVYKTAVFWSVVASFCIVQEAYDTLLLGSLFALPAFKEHFGYNAGGKAGYQISAPWQAGLQQGANMGSLIGVFLGAFLVDRVGYKYSILGNLIILAPIIALVTFAPNLGALLAGEILCGIPWGVFSTLAEAYASEICPQSLRGYLTTFVNLCWVLGHFIGAGVLRAANNITGKWSYRMPFAVQWVWIPILVPLMVFAPESPYWFVRKGKLSNAEKTVRRIAPAAEQGRVHEIVSSMVRTNQFEKDVTAGTTFADCFRGVNRRRTEISCVVWTTQILCGLQFANYSTYFFQQAGLATTYSFDMTIGLYAAAFIGTCLSWVLLTFLGRRKIWLAGLSALVVGQILIGVLSVVADKGHTGARWAQAGLMIGWLFTYDMTVGPLAYAIVGETSSTRLRNKTVGLARASYNVFSICFGVMMPYMLNPTQWNWAGKTGFFWAGIGFLCLLWAYFRLPELKDRSFLEADIMFTRGVPARKFRTYVIEANADEHVRQDIGK
ncbi:uncharacterized protein I303_104091 [Kwoniella dejecticola CBS 10117]|uniref:Major facilitator superfamily (MFS) profile domain-containing protein n=1 Tax=Kwoniella dejecticola CBS 10117 TaxID=1296121 RepID=A0A1A6A8K7_9TREE|nr:uncharacterized protein I303_04109 [Kwoniella dejecticola CBS 10117]OBR86385.1 hypothetical protein I303_04109 [Kwoniella dejecticola CBS 10117]